MKFGIDVSHWDAQPIDWKKADMDFIYVKVSEGYMEDVLFRKQWDIAKGKVLRGAYHFFRPYRDPKRSAQKTVDILGNDLGELPLALDLETIDNRKDTLSRAKIWVYEYVRLTGLNPIIYSTIPFMKLIGANHTTLFGMVWKHSWLIGRDFWLAQYPFDNIGDAKRDTKVANILNGIEKLEMKDIDTFPPLKTIMWQWTSRAKPSMIKGYYTGKGSKKAVDYNFVNEEWLAQWRSK